MNTNQTAMHRREAEDRWLLGLDPAPTEGGTLNVRVRTGSPVRVDVVRAGRIVWSSPSTPPTTRPRLRALPAQGSGTHD